MGVATLLGAAFGIASFSQQAKASKQAKKAAQAQIKAQQLGQRIANVRAARERRQQVAQARVLQAQQLAGGFSAGVGRGSSAVQGAVSSIGSQAASNVGFSQQVAGLSALASEQNILSAQYQSQAATSQAYGNMFAKGASIFSGPTFS
jgi:hypothetical protein